MPLQSAYGERTINELLLMFKSRQINLNPGFQRNSVWTLTDRRRLIQSVLARYPLPSIFLYERRQKGGVVYDVIDGALLAGDLPSHTHAASDITSGSMPFAIKKAGATIGTRRALNLIEGANIGLTVADDAGNDRVNVTVALASVPAHNHGASDINSGTVALARGGTGADLSATGPGFLKQAGGGSAVTVAALVAADIPAHDTSKLTSGSLALARGGAGTDLSATGPGFLKQAAVGSTITVAALSSGDLPSHTHTSAQISDATAAATASTVVLRDGSAGANFGYVAANNLWAYLESHLQSVECGRVRNGGRRVREHGEVL